MGERNSYLAQNFILCICASAFMPCPKVSVWGSEAWFCQLINGKGWNQTLLAHCLVYPSRLETRTKEFSIHASERVYIPKRVSKEIAGQRWLFLARLTSHQVVYAACVRACILRPERTWTMPVLGEAGRKSCGGSARYWRANRSYQTGVGAKD